MGAFCITAHVLLQSDFQKHRSKHHSNLVYLFFLFIFVCLDIYAADDYVQFMASVESNFH